MPLFITSFTKYSKPNFPIVLIVNTSLSTSVEGLIEQLSSSIAWRIMVKSVDAIWRARVLKGCHSFLRPLPLIVDVKWPKEFYRKYKRQRWDLCETFTAWRFATKVLSC